MTIFFPNGKIKLEKPPKRPIFSRTGKINANLMQHITTVAELGKIIRAKRKQDELTQFEVACICGVGIRFLSELENGKPTVEFTKVLKVLHCLGLKLMVMPRTGYERQ
jgi:HTH-type transcriptional regulator/antitoxin HipB